MLHAGGVAGKACVLGLCGLVHGGAKACKLPVVANRQQHIAIAGFEVLVRCQAGVGVASTLGCLPGGQKTCGLIGQYGHAHIQQCHVDVLACA
ncbi:hypothetical protein D3C72_1930870 [compost metagenome]